MNRTLVFVAAATVLAASSNFAASADKASSTFLTKAIEGNFAEGHLEE
jgi:hypothetical protein